MKETDIYNQLKDGLPEHKLPPGAVTMALVARIKKWHRFYLAVFRNGWCETGLPRAEGIAAGFFDDDLIETKFACRLFPTWVNAALPKEKLDQMMIEATGLLAAGWDAERIADRLLELPEPKRDIAIATWYSILRSRLR
jgi:hypothetical protein